MEHYDWNEISTRDKLKINQSKSIFIFGSREISVKRIQQLTKQLETKGNLLWGILKDEFIPVLEGSPQFKTLKIENFKRALSEDKKKINTVSYYQRDTRYLLEELKFTAAIFINGSWNRLLHLHEEFWQVERSRTPYKLVSSFVDEKEAKKYYSELQRELKLIGNFSVKKRYTENELMSLAKETSRRSFDTSAQVGAVLAKRGKVLLTAHNVVVPYETRGMHTGFAKEKNFSPVNDQNHYDTNHAELELIIKAGEKGISLRETELYIPLMPCPACARAISRTEIAKVVYSHDHSDGYAAKLFAASGIETKRLLI